jgi:hypothetical protein
MKLMIFNPLALWETPSRFIPAPSSRVGGGIHRKPRLIRTLDVRCKRTGDPAQKFRKGSCLATRSGICDLDSKTFSVGQISNMYINLVREHAQRRETPIHSWKLNLWTTKRIIRYVIQRRPRHLREEFVDGSIPFLVLLEHLYKPDDQRDSYYKADTTREATNLSNRKFKIFLSDMLPPFTQRIHP